MVADLRHPHIAQVVRAGRFPDRTPFVAMERLTGQTLDERIAGGRTVPAQELLAIVRGITSALSAAHGAGIAHGQLRADNVFIADLAGYPSGFTKLLDFGVARLTAAAGQPDSGGAADGGTAGISEISDAGPRADQRALAALTYRLLTGRDPFPAAPGRPDRSGSRRSQPRPASALVGTGPAIDAVLGKALSPHPEDRFDSVGQLFRAIEEALTGALLVSSGSVAVAVPLAAASPAAAPVPARTPEPIAPASPTDLATLSLAQQFFAEGERQEALAQASSSLSLGTTDAAAVSAAIPIGRLDRLPKRRAPLIGVALLAIVALGIAARAAGVHVPPGWRGAGIARALHRESATPPPAPAAPIASPTAEATPPSAAAAPATSPEAEFAPAIEKAQKGEESDAPPAAAPAREPAERESPPERPAQQARRAPRELPPLPPLRGYAWSPQRGLVPADVAHPPPDPPPAPAPPPAGPILEPPAFSSDPPGR
jgi:serine/threonine-protein kinase